MVQEHCCSLWDKWTVAKWETVVWQNVPHFDILLGCCVPWTKGPSGSLSALRSEACITGGFRVHQCPLNWTEGTVNAASYVKVSEQHSNYASIQTFFPFQGKLCIFKQHNVKPLAAPVTTALLCRSLSAALTCLRSRHFTRWEHLDHHESPARAARSLCQRGTGPHFSPKGSAPALCR